VSDIRHWAEEDASAEEQALLASARAEVPDPSARLRTLQALGIAGGPPAPGGGAGPGTAGAGPGAGVAAPLVKIAAAVLLVGGVVVGLSLARRSVPSVAPSAPPAAVTAPEASPASAAAPAAGHPTPPEPAPRAPATEPGRRPRRRAPAPEVAAGAPAPTLAAEVQALEQAHRALAARDAAAALGALDRYDAAFPTGKLAAEAVVLRVRALLLDGQRARAVALANAFAARHPDTVHARQLDALVRGAAEAGAPEKK
jgi:hypothetical protein